jgi:creatinine amidohydrolase/Fe(II)-dependent formamide hydrolase-like protein
MLKQIPDTLKTTVHGTIPPRRFWGYYTGPEIAEIGETDPNATAVLSVGAVEQHGPHLPVITDSMHGPEILGAALARLPDDAMVLGLPPTVYGKSVEHQEWPGTITYSGDTLRAVMMDIATSVARSGFSKLVLAGSHGGNNGIIDDYFRDLQMATGLRVFKIHIGSIANVPGLTSPEEAAVSMHAGDSETSLIRHLAPELVNMDRAEGHLYDPHPAVGYSFKGNDAIESWVSANLSASGAIGNPHTSDPEKGRIAFEAKVARLADLLEQIYRLPKRDIHVAPTASPTATPA